MKELEAHPDSEFLLLILHVQGSGLSLDLDLKPSLLTLQCSPRLSLRCPGPGLDDKHAGTSLEEELIRCLFLSSHFSFTFRELEPHPHSEFLLPVMFKGLDYVWV